MWTGNMKTNSTCLSQRTAVITETDHIEWHDGCDFLAFSWILGIFQAGVLKSADFFMNNMSHRSLPLSPFQPHNRGIWRLNNQNQPRDDGANDDDTMVVAIKREETGATELTTPTAWAFGGEGALRSWIWWMSLRKCGRSGFHGATLHTGFATAFDGITMPIDNDTVKMVSESIEMWDYGQYFVVTRLSSEIFHHILLSVPRNVVRSRYLMG